MPPRQLHLKFARPAQRLADRIREIAATQVTPNIPLAEALAKSKEFQKCSQVIQRLVQSHRDDNASRSLRPPPALLPPVF